MACPWVPQTDFSGFMVSADLPTRPSHSAWGSGGGWVALLLCLLPPHEAAPLSSHDLSSGFGSPGSGLPVLLLSRTSIDGVSPRPTSAGSQMTVCCVPCGPRPLFSVPLHAAFVCESRQADVPLVNSGVDRGPLTRYGAA